MYTHTIAIARCLLTEGRLSDVDRMISPLLPDYGHTSSSSDEELFLRCLLAQARLFSGTTPEAVLEIFSTETDAGITESAKHLESAIASMCIGLALVQPSPQQDLPRALHLLHLTQDTIKSLGRSDFLHWTYIGQAMALYSLHEYKEASTRLEKAATYLFVLKDHVALHWVECLSKAFKSRSPIPFTRLSQIEESGTNNNVRAPLSDQVYVSEQMHGLLQDCQLAAEGTAPILLLGERGSGKETAARLIHALQSQDKGTFEVVDCAAVTADWNATQYFDNDQVPALRQKTLFLNHIEHLPEPQQLSLLAYLKNFSAINRLGSMPLRIISASSAELAKCVSQGKFNLDLYHRLKISTLEIPPLRMRKHDIPILALHFSRALRPAGVSHVAITEHAFAAFLRYDWPGNIRQLKNEIERILVHIGMDPLPTIDLQNLSKAIRQKRKPLANLAEQDVSAEYPLEEILTDTERTVIERVLSKYHGQVSSAASALGLTRQGLYKKLNRLGIRR